MPFKASAICVILPYPHEIDLPALVQEKQEVCQPGESEHLFGVEQAVPREPLELPLPPCGLLADVPAAPRPRVVGPAVDEHPVPHFGMHVRRQRRSERVCPSEFIGPTQVREGEDEVLQPGAVRRAVGAQSEVEQQTPQQQQCLVRRSQGRGEDVEQLIVEQVRVKLRDARDAHTLC